MAVEDDDNIEIDFTIRNTEQAEGAINRVMRASEIAAQRLTAVFAAGDKYQNDTSANLFKVQNSVQALTAKYVQLANAAKNIGNTGDKGIVSNAANAQVSDLTQKLARLQEIDKQFADGFGRGTARAQRALKTEADEIVNSLQRIEREYINLKQVALTAQLDPAAPKIRNISPEYLDRRIERLQGRSSTYFNQFGGLTGLDTNDTRYSGISNAARLSQISIRGLDAELKKLENDFSKLDKKDAQGLLEINKEASRLNAELRNAHRNFLTLKSAVKDIKPDGPVLGRGGRGGGGGNEGGLGPGDATGYGGKFLNAFGIGGFTQSLGPIAALGALTVGIERFIHYSDLALEKASEQAKANRLLASSAVEAGLSYDQLAQKNKAFARQTGLSDVGAALGTSRVAQLATRSGRPQDIDKLLKGFADLGAARGLDSTELETVIQQIITGQDEGYKKLLLPNPSLLYKQAADKQGRSVGSLSYIERSQIFQAEFLKKAELFNGSADAKLQSIDGRVQKLHASFENLGYGLATYFANTPDVVRTIDDVTDAVGRLVGSLSELEKKRNPVTGIISDKDISEAARPGIIGLGRRLLGAAIGPVFQYGANELVNDGQTTNEDLIRRQLNAKKLQDAQQAKLAAEARQRIDEENAEEERKRNEAIAEQKYRDQLNDPNHTLAQLREIRDRFRDSDSGFGGDAAISTEKQKTLALDAEKAISHDKLEQYTLDLQKPNIKIGELRDNLVKLKSDIEIYTPDRTRGIQQYEAAINGLKDKVAQTRDSFVDFLLNTNVDNNPFQKILADITTASQEAEKFKNLGGDAVSYATNQKLADAEKRRYNQRLDNESEALKLRQEAARLDRTPATETGGFVRRLDTLEKSIDFVQKDRSLKTEEDRARFVGYTFDPNGRFNSLDKYSEEGQYGQQYGYQGLDKLQKDFETPGKKRGESSKDYFKRATDARHAFIDTNIKIQDYFADFNQIQSVQDSGLGIYGQEAVAKAKLERLPTDEELIPRLNGYGQTKTDAQDLLRQRADAQTVLRQANKKRYEDLIANQKFLDRNRADADERIAQLSDSRYAGADDLKKIDELLNITGEIGTAELTPDEKQARIRALNAKADIKSSQEKIQEDRNKALDKMVTSINDQIAKNGLKVDLGDKTIVDINLNIPNGASSSATSTRPTQSNVNTTYQ